MAGVSPACDFGSETLFAADLVETSYRLVALKRQITALDVLTQLLTTIPT